MMECPEKMGDMKIVCFASIDPKHRHTRRTRLMIDRKAIGSLRGLAICEGLGHHSFYMFSCNDAWASITDSWHQSLKEAHTQAESEYAGVSETWKFKPS